MKIYCYRRQKSDTRKDNYYRRRDLGATCFRPPRPVAGGGSTVSFRFRGMVTSPSAARFLPFSAPARSSSICLCARVRMILGEGTALGFRRACLGFCWTIGLGGKDADDDL